jgi:hypothetical protein
MANREHVERVFLAEKLAPGGQNLFQHHVDPWVAEVGEPGRRPHRPVKDGAQRRGHHPALAELGRHRQHFIYQAQQLLHALQVPLAVRLGTWHLGDPLVHVHAHHGIGVNQLLKLDHHRMQRYLLPPVLHPFPVTGEPRLQVVLVIR